MREIAIIASIVLLLIATHLGVYDYGYEKGKKEATKVMINGLDKDCQNTEFDTAVILITKDTLSMFHAQEFLKLCYKTNYLYIKVNRGTQNHLILK
jgi:hypothetical protein